MEDADKLVELFFSWQKKQEKCSEMLLDLAQELETLRCISSTTQIVGSVTSVVGFAAAGVAALLTAGLAVLLAVGATGTVLSFSSKAVEVGWSIKTTIEAKKMIEEVEKIGREIQYLMRSLKDQYGRHAGDDASTDSSDDEECEVITRIMGALAKRNNIDVPLDLLRSFNNDTFFYRRNLGRRRPNEAALKWMSGAVTVVLLSMLNTTLNVSGKKALKSFGIIGMKTLIKRSAVVASSSLAVVMSLYDLYENCKEMLRDSHVTEASQSLRDATKQMKEDTRTLKKKLNALLDIIKQLAEVKELIQNLGENSFVKEKDRQRILDYIRATCHDPTILFWLDTCEDETVLNIISLLMNQIALKMRERSKRDEEDKEDIHIVFVAHGSITDQFVPAASLVSENITDTLLYSPWNCLIHANAAYGIAKGCIGLQQRQFLTCRGFNTNPDPRPVLPQHWNSMRKSKHDVPQIVLSPVGVKEPVWHCFSKHIKTLNRDDRIIIPYLNPNEKNILPDIPFQYLIFMLSVALRTMGRHATVHLAACLGHNGSDPNYRCWGEQYAYTDNGVYMSMDIEEDSLLLQAFRLMFVIQGDRRATP